MVQKSENLIIIIIIIIMRLTPVVIKGGWKPDMETTEWPFSCPPTAGIRER